MSEYNLEINSTSNPYEVGWCIDSTGSLDEICRKAITAKIRFPPYLWYRVTTDTGKIIVKF